MTVKKLNVSIPVNKSRETVRLARSSVSLQIETGLSWRMNHRRTFVRRQPSFPLRREISRKVRLAFRAPRTRVRIVGTTTTIERGQWPHVSYAHTGRTYRMACIKYAQLLLLRRTCTRKGTRDRRRVTGRTGGRGVLVARDKSGRRRAAAW